MPFKLTDHKEEKKQFSENPKEPLAPKDERQEVEKISEMLNPDEKILLVAKQSRIKPGGCYFSPNTIYATDIASSYEGETIRNNDFERKPTINDKETVIDIVAANKNRVLHDPSKRKGSS